MYIVVVAKILLFFEMEKISAKIYGFESLLSVLLKSNYFFSVILF